jgi:hypothetical protein
MTANIELRGEKAEKVLAVPVEAVFKKEDKQVVYVLKSPFDEPKPGEKKLRPDGSGSTTSPRRGSGSSKRRK